MTVTEIHTEIRVIHADGHETRQDITLPGNYDAVVRYDALKHLIEDDILGGNYMEHVNVFADFDGGRNNKYLDMFVDEEGKLKGLPLNPVATAIYHNNMIAHGQGHLIDGDPIVGTAILFRDKVWF